ncbi:MAG: phospho-sugar mutase [Parachlamydia sp.]|jgi:phosphoglucomutase/phosphomannomutase|nr:phospho-sugar mutase [Parachlamydia sp.]
MSTNDNIHFDLETQKNVDHWLDGQYDEETKKQIKSMLAEDPKQVIDAFFTHLNFGTGGLRGIMGVGTNRMNIYTVRAATQGLANYILKQTEQQKPSVFIGYDSRLQSRQFAEETAKVLAGNEIEAYIFKNIRPTPLVSFGCRFKGCTAAVMVTASHNPPIYNGYKVYWSDGGQLVPPNDSGVIAEAAKVTDPSLVRSVPSLDHPLIHEIEEEVDQAYLSAIKSLQNYPDVNRQEGKRIKIAYTSLHGTGITLMPQALKEWGFTTVSYVESQIIPDGSFPTVNSPNPEEKAAMELGIKKMLENQSDVLIANDPDADRIGVAVLYQGEAVLLNGNQICVLLLEHVCEALAKENRLPPNAAFIKTIGTTELFKAICDFYKRPSFNVLTGFKYIAEKIHEWEVLPNGHQFIFGGEESYGYLLGTFSRDKDAILCSALICEAALQAKIAGKTLVDQLHDLYHKYGVYQEKLLSINFGETKEGKEQMSLGMQKIRSSHLLAIDSIPVAAIEDYSSSTKYDVETGKTEPIQLPVSDVLLYWLNDGTKVMIRPSGTEPKVKIYCGLVEKNFNSIEEGIEACQKRCDAILNFMKNQLVA